MKSSKEVLLDDLQTAFVIGLIITLLILPAVLANLAEAPIFYWFYAFEGTIFYILTVIARMKD